MPITEHEQKVRVSIFNGGEDSTSEKTLVVPPFATIARNCLLDEPGRIIQRLGLTAVGDNPDILISKYTFDASNATDDKSTNDGVETNITYSDGKFGKCAEFNSNTSLITIPADSSIDITSMGPFVMTCWVAPNGAGQNDTGMIWSKGNSYACVKPDTSTTVILEFAVKHSTTTAKVITSTTISADVENQTFTKVEFHYNADKSLDIFINGAVASYSTDDTGDGTVEDDSSDDLILGNNVGVTATFDGCIDDFRIYDGTRAAAAYEMNKIYGLGTFKVGATIDKLYRIRNTSLESLQSTLKGWDSVATGFTANKDTSLIQANGELWILNGVDRPHVLTTASAIKTKINPAEQTTGTGLDDITSGGTYTGTADAVFEIEITSEDTPDVFKWKKDDGEYTTAVDITGSAQTLSDGVTITFDATTGHSAGDIWKVYVYPDEGIGAELGEAGGSKYNAPNCSLGAWAQNNRMFLSGHLNEALFDYVWFSNTLDAHTYNTTAGTGNFFRVQSGTSGKVTQLKPFKLNELIIYKTDSIFALDMTGATPLTDWTLQPVNTDIGCVAGRTVKDIGNDQIFLDKEGNVRLLSRTTFDKLKTSIISGPVQDFLDQINITHMHKACAELIDGRYYLAFPSGSSTENNVVLVWDSVVAGLLGKSDAGWTVITGSNWVPSYMTTWEFGDDKISLAVGDSRAVSLVYQHTGNSDNGQTIDFQLAGQQHDGGNRGTEKIWGPLYVVAQAGVEAELVISVELNNQGFIDIGTIDLSGGVVNLPIDLPFELGGEDKTESMFHVKRLGRGRTCRIKVTNRTYNQQVEFNEYELYYQERTMRE